MTRYNELMVLIPKAKESLEAAVNVYSSNEVYKITTDTYILNIERSLNDLKKYIEEFKIT